MRHFLVIILFLSSKVYANGIGMDSKTRDITDSLSKACLSVKAENMRFCGDYQAITQNVSEFGQYVSDKVIHSIPYPEAAVVSGFLIKALVDQKVVLDPKIKDWGNPKLEIKPQQTVISLSYDL